MRRIPFTASFVGLAFLLSACLGNLIGEQPAPDALGLDGTTVTTSKSSATAAGFTPQQVDETFVGGFDATFKDIDLEAIEAEAPIALPDPKAYTETIGVQSGVTVYSSTTDALPETISITGVQLDVTVADSDGTPSLDFQFGEDGNADITLTRGECTAATGALEAHCTYAASGIDSLLLLSIGGGSFTDLWQNVLTNQDPANQDAVADQNTLDGSVTLYVDTAAGTPADTEIQLVLNTANGTIDFSN